MSIGISVQSVSKKFTLKHTRPRTLHETFIRRLTGQYDPGKIIWALRDVSFDIRKGQALGVIGHNGAGKSTLLRLLCGIGRPTSGTIQQFGSVGALLQLASFHSMMTGRENIRTAGMLNGLTRKQMESLEEEMIAFAELEEFIDQPVRTYSEGMTLRLAFSAAVHFDPDILIIDEILTVGDIRFQEKCSERIKQFQRAGKTLIVTSHEMEQIKHFCDDVIVLEEGQLVFRSDPETAVKMYLDLMRQRTEKRAAILSTNSSVVIPQPQQGSRSGTQEATITSVRIQDETGSRIETISSGTPLTVEMDVQMNSPISDFAVTVGIFTDNDFKCFEGRVDSARQMLGCYNGSGRIECRIPGLPLAPGRYFVHVGLYPTNWEYVYDYHWQVHSFHVVGNLPYVSGILSVLPKWSLKC